MKLILTMTLMTLGTSCSPEVISVTDLSWYTEVKFSNETKRWFDKSKPPQFVVKDLNVIFKNNKKYKAIRDSQ